MIGSHYSCPDPGAASKLTAYIGRYLTHNCYVKGAIYRHSDRVLVAKTEEIYIGPGYGAGKWQDFNIIWGGTLEATEYWLLLWGRPTPLSWYFYHDYHETDNDKRYWKDYAYDDWPDPAPPPYTTGAHMFSIYCTYTPVAIGYGYGDGLVCIQGG